MSSTYSLLAWMVKYHLSRKKRNRFNLDTLQTRFDRAEDPEETAKENDREAKESTVESE